LINIDHSKARYLFDGFTGEAIPEELAGSFRSFLAIENLFVSATREITTKLENLNDEFKTNMDRNPIHEIRTRVKTPKSIMNKLLRKGHEISVDSARANLDDIAGVRVICPYIDDTRMIADLLISQDDITLLRKSDYINNPKPNGYRSLHLVVTVPVFLSKNTEYVKVEVQIRTIAMDFWASLEHDLAYKLPEEKAGKVIEELKECADVINQTDERMQKLFNILIT
jgi:putative GTP pyrophosphokinase